jgi:hypothetical protein
VSNDAVALRDARERTIARLTEHFTHDQLEVAEYERRIAAAHRAESVAALDDVVAGLPALTAPVPVVHRAELLPDAPERRRMLAILGGVDRRGPWNCPRHLRVVAALGGVSLDLREARFAPGVTDIEVTALFGGVEIIVPPELAVETEGSGILGGFAALDHAPSHADPDRPLVRVHGLAVFGGVAVQMRLPGEGERAARRRERRARRRLR